jgi:methylase of polypeptide subunit release factors
MGISDIHNRLTSDISIEESKHLVLEFARELGWSPSYFIKPSKIEKSNGYLVVEHGLQNSAILSFLKERNEDLTLIEEETLLSLSYNNLVSWHITIDSRYINYYYILNREKRKVETCKIESGNEAEALSVNKFYEIITKKPNANIKALDDVLIDNISYWKRLLSAELNNNIDVISLSHLFNSVIFLRSIEDGKKRSNKRDNSSRILLDILSQEPVKNNTISNIIRDAEIELEIIIPDYIVSKEKISLFDTIDRQILRRFFTSFYENDFNRFRYDFSIMTKQALSRIYQKYVSILSIPSATNQISLFNISQIPSERANKDIGAYYTPEYIARFFAKYICNKYTEKEFDKLQILEPAVGSGIFLRTLLETQIEQRILNQTNINIDKLFSNVIGIDIDPNAALATNLSLTLLHYVFNETFLKPNVMEGDSVVIMEDKIKQSQFQDIVIANPPYINQDNKEEETINKYKIILNGFVNGKVDSYQVFLKLSIDILSPNGLGLFVLPHNFLISKSSKKLRNYLLETCDIELVADLSAINVFDKVSTYTILLIFRKKDKKGSLNSNSWLLKCRSSVGEALNQVLIGNETVQKQFQIYKADNYFKSDGDWFILNKAEFDLLRKMKENRRIDEFLRVNQGIITGNDDIFIRQSSDVKRSERGIYKSYLPDKDINKFSLEKKYDKLLFYPYRNNELISEEELKSKYDSTWAYLKDKILDTSSPGWYDLHRKRKSEYINSPKIITPYISIMPKFALDSEGSFVTSRSPYFILKDDSLDLSLLYYFLGILNSAPCYWLLSLQAQKQSSGYNIFTLDLLKTTPVPDPTINSNTSLVSLMVNIVLRRVKEKNELKKIQLENEINKIAFELYQLSDTEKKLFEYEY